MQSILQENVAYLLCNSILFMIFYELIFSVQEWIQ